MKNSKLLIKIVTIIITIFLVCFIIYAVKLGLLEDKEIKFDSYIELSNIEAILNYVKLNIGVSCVPYMSVLSEENSKSINVYRIKDHKINRSLYSAIHKVKYISKPIECFMKFCEKTDI